MRRAILLVLALACGSADAPAPAPTPEPAAQEGAINACQSRIDAYLAKATQIKAEGDAILCDCNNVCGGAQ